jgi:hypothetical protein
LDTYSDRAVRRIYHGESSMMGAAIGASDEEDGLFLRVASGDGEGICGSTRNDPFDTGGDDVL